MTRARARTTGGLVTALVMTAALLVAGLSARPTQAGPTFETCAYSVSEVDNILYEISLTDGTAIPLGPPLEFLDVEGLTFTPDLSRLLGVDSELDVLIELFPDGTATELGPVIDEISGLPLDLDSTGLAFLGDLLYLSNQELDPLDPESGILVNTLYVLSDPAVTAGESIAAFVGSLGQPVTGLASDGVSLVGLGGIDDNDGLFTNNLVAVNDLDATTTEIGPLGLGFDLDDGGIDYDPISGTLWGIEDADGSGGEAGHLFVIDPTLAPGDLVDPASLIAIVDAEGNFLTGFEGLAIGPCVTDECSGEIKVNAKKLTFGDVKVDKGKKRSFNIRNLSKDEPLFVSLSLDEKSFELVDEETEFTIEPGERITVVVRFRPESRGKHTGTLTILSSDCEAGEITVKLVGKGIKNKKR